MMKTPWWKFWDPQSGFVGGLIFVWLIVISVVSLVAGALCLK